MSVSPLTSVPAVAGVKRSSPDPNHNHDLDSPPKKARVDSTREVTSGSLQKPRTPLLDDSRALIPLLGAAVKDALDFVQPLSADQILALEAPRPQPVHWACFCSVLANIQSHLSPDTIAEWATNDERHTLRQALLLCTLQAFLSHDLDSIPALKTGLDFLLDGDGDVLTAEWCADFLELIESCLRNGEEVSTGGRLREVISMLASHGLVPAARLDSTANGDQAVRLNPAINVSSVANDPVQERSHQPVAGQLGESLPLSGSGTSANNEVLVEDEFDFMAIARRAAQSALNPHPDETPTETSTSALPQAQQLSKNAGQFTTKNLPTRTPQTSAQPTPITTNDDSSKSNATLIAQYEEARAFAAQRSQQKRLVTTNPNSARRPWTEEEENTLMRGLDQLHGPFWAQILELYGEYGTHSTILRGRTQVQLKDKARNLKLYFLKNDLPVPDSLRYVTGVLKPKAHGSQDAGKTSSEERTS